MDEALEAKRKALELSICNLLKAFQAELPEDECVSDIWVGPFTDEGEFNIAVILESEE